MIAWPMSLRLSALVVSLSVTAVARCQQSRAVFDAPVVVLPNDEHAEALLDFDGDTFADTVSVWLPNVSTIEYRGYRNDRTGAFARAWTTVLTVPPHTVGLQESTTVVPGNFDGVNGTDFASFDRGSAWYFLSGPGNGSPTVQWTLTFPVDVQGLATLDFDHDGLDDLAVATTSGVSLYRTRSGASPVLAATMPISARMRLATADFDGDGNVDLAIDNMSQGQVRFVQVLPQGFGQTVTVSTGSFFTGLSTPVAGDLDGDGRPDLALFYNAVGGNALIRGLGGFSFAAAVVAYQTHATHLYDVDGDGDLDGVCCSSGGGPNPFVPSVTLPQQAEMRFSLNDGTGQFAPAVEITNAYAQHLAGAVDLDHDGDLDFVAGRAVLYGTGRSPAEKAPVGAESSFFDLDGDGDLDVRAGFPGFQRNRGDGTFEAPWSPMVQSTSALSHGPIVGDFDGDGDVDMLFGRTIDGVILRNLGNGSFVETGLALASGTFSSPAYGPGSPLDVDADGDLDVLVLPNIVYLNDGSGMFTRGPDLVGTPTGDLNGDGIGDVYRVTAAGSVEVALGLGGGAFGPFLVPGTAIVIGSSDLPKFADLDGDGDIDVLGPRAGTGLLAYHNDGSGQLGPGVLLDGESLQSPIAQGAHVALVADVDGDGDVDIVYGPTSGGYATFDVLLQDAATHQFGAPVTQTGRIRWNTDAVDLDGDGDLELALMTNQGVFLRGATFDGAAGGSIVQYGVGSPTTPLAQLVLGDIGPFRVGESGRVVMRGGIGGMPCVLAIGSQRLSVPLFGGTLFTDAATLLFFTLGGAPGVAGAGTLDLPWTLQPSAAGVRVTLQCAALDPGAPSSIALSHGLEVTIGN